MPRVNVILVYNTDYSKILFCRRVKDPYKGLYNLVGGHVEAGETGIEAAYRELFEETGIGQEDITLYHLMDFTYYTDGCCVESYVGKLNHPVNLIEEANPLTWIAVTENFFDTRVYAGEGNIGHMVEIAKLFKDKIWGSDDR